MILRGDCMARMKELPDRSVHCIVTSPPYWGLRSYLPRGSEGKRFEIGCEPTWQQYVNNLVLVFREARRILRNDGLLFLNLGDCYITGAGAANSPGGGAQGEKWRGDPTQPNRMPQTGIKPKEVAGLPWRVALALSDDGWYLRQDFIWCKGLSFLPTYAGSVMPESVIDRATKSHEYVFMLCKSESYFFDQEAVKEAATHTSEAKYHNGLNGYGGRENGTVAGSSTRKFAADPGKRNLRSVWVVPTKPFKGAHFATMPPALVEPCVKAGTSEKGVCPDCGAPWIRIKREVGKSVTPAMIRAGANQSGGYSGHGIKDYKSAAVQNPSDTKRRILDSMSKTFEYDWEPSCGCGGGLFPLKEPVPATVMDPFGGSGTTKLVAEQLGRKAIIIELNPEYAAIAEERTKGTPNGT